MPRASDDAYENLKGDLRELSNKIKNSLESDSLLKLNLSGRNMHAIGTLQYLSYDNMRIIAIHTAQRYNQITMFPAVGTRS
jgi:hypothetical protein